MPHDQPLVPSAYPALRGQPTPIRLLAGVTLALLAACQHDATTPGEPGTRVTALAAAAGAAPRDMLSKRLSNTPGACIVAVRTPEGKYLSRTISVRMPAGIASSVAGTSRFAYRGWAAEVPQPAVLAVCTFPDTPAARAHFSNRFRGAPMRHEALRSFARSARVPGAQDWAPRFSPHIMQGAEPVYMTDGLASDYLESSAALEDGGMLMYAEMCDPAALIPEPRCATEVEETAPDPETPPPSEGIDSSMVPIVAEPDYSTSPSIVNVCESLTEEPHRSTTTGFIGRINVKSRTTCAQPANLVATVGLYRQQCYLYVFCSWPRIAYGEDRRFGTRAEAKANRDCAWPKGWYAGRGFSSAASAEGSGSASTYSRSKYIEC